MLVAWQGDADLVLLSIPEQPRGVHLEDQHGAGQTPETQGRTGATPTQ